MPFCVVYMVLALGQICFTEKLAFPNWFIHEDVLMNQCLNGMAVKDQRA